MKRLTGYFVVAGAVLLGGVWVAAQVSLNTFEPGTVIESSAVNENFKALNEGKQNRITGACAEGFAVRIVNEDGTVVCEMDDGGGGGNAGVQSLNGQTGAISLQAGSNIAIDDSESGQIVISTTATTTSAIPAGAVMSFNLQTCPDGWSLFTEGIGRTVVGYAPGGTLAGTVGEDLDNLESRAHGHLNNPPDQIGFTSTDGSHNHVWAEIRTADWYSGDGTKITNWDDGMGTGGDGFYPPGSPGLRQYKYLTSSDGDHSHSVSLDSFISGPGASHLPYIQLLMCQKD